MVKVSQWLMGPLKTTELANQENVRLKQKDNTRTVDRRPVALEKKSLSLTSRLRSRLTTALSGSVFRTIIESSMFFWLEKIVRQLDLARCGSRVGSWLNPTIIYYIKY